MDQNYVREYSNSWSSVIDSVRKGRSWSGDERNCFYLNLRGDNFVDLSYVSGLDFKNDGRGIGLTDWDRDGDIDIIYRNRDAPRVRVIKNNFTNSPESLSIRLRGINCNRDAIGSRVELELEGRMIMRSIKAGEMFLSQSTKWAHFGLSSGEVPKKATVYWPGGDSEVFTGLNRGGRYLLVEGSGVSQRVDSPNQVQLEGLSDNTEEKQYFPNRVIFPIKFPLPKISYRSADASIKVLEPEGESIILNLWSGREAKSVDGINFIMKFHHEFKKKGINFLPLSIDGIDDAGLAYEVIDKAKYEGSWGFIDEQSIEGIRKWFMKVFEKHEKISSPFSLLVDASGNCIALFRSTMEGVTSQDLVEILSMQDIERWHKAPLMKGTWFTFPPNEKYIRSIFERN